VCSSKFFFFSFFLVDSYLKNNIDNFPSPPVQAVVFSIVPCLPFCVYQYIAQSDKTHWDKAIAIVLVIWHVLQLGAVVRAISRIMKEQKRRFDIARVVHLEKNE